MNIYCLKEIIAKIVITKKGKEERTRRNMGSELYLMASSLPLSLVWPRICNRKSPKVQPEIKMSEEGLVSKSMENLICSNN